MDTSEKRFEYDIEQHLISHGYEQFNGQDADGNWVHTRQHDVAKCIYMDVLCEFIAKTQPKEWAKYTKYYGDNAPGKLYHRLETTITNQGLLYVLRNGIEDMGCKLKVCFFKPESDLNPLATERYEANILGCTRQFRYSTANTNTIDMVLSVNGIPVVALELKNQLTGQDYICAINQYKSDRSSKEFAFRLNHRFLVYFAVDLYEAWMTTQLADGKTRFLPFNQGSNGAGVTGGAGNPQNPNGYATSYLWEEVLQRDSMLDLIHRFISFVKEKEEVITNGVSKTVTKEKMIFPRYHQYDVVRKIMADVKHNGVGQNYLIQHSAGSGKSNSIAWIAYRLASVHDADNNGLFDSVIVVTNRVVLDSQLQDTINSFEHQVGLVEAIDDKKNSRSLAEAINDKKRIIICTIQKFLFAKKDMEKFRGRKFAIIIDEAHQGQNGESAKALRRSLIDIGVAVKEYAAQKQVATQFVREKTIESDLHCQIMWALSLALYVKSGRTPWVVNGIQPDTAFAGIGYSVMNGPSDSNVVVGCSHIYSSDGCGMKYKLSKIQDYTFDRKKNPYLSEEEAYRIGLNIKELFYKSFSELPKRVVIHKRTPFRKEEVKGLVESLSSAGVKNIELLEITYEDNLKCFALNERCTQVDGYPVRRGMCFPIDKNTMYLFTHGIAPSVISQNRRYFQGGKSVPLPLRVVKHYGSGDMAQIATEILGLSKMNWNSFGLYSKLPCTIESSNEIARIGWLLSQFEGSLYDYRFFM